jgi:hypothetical protein
MRGPKMADLLADPARLRRRYEHFARLRKARMADGPQLEALAECCFRLATHSKTPPADSRRLLREACSADSANPKFAYHLARLFLIEGNLEKAASWLSLAVRLCPTSHRIWTHICILQRRLNERHRGVERFEPDALRGRAKLIAAGVLAGHDRFEEQLMDFVPPVSSAVKELEERRRAELGGNGDLIADPAPPAPTAASASTAAQLPKARRLVRAGKCRWSGMIDLEMEDRLEAPPSSFGLKEIMPLFEQIAAGCTSRRGGTSAFAIAACQWLVAGYPVATVRRLLSRLPEERFDAALILVDLVCQLFEVDEANLPRTLADALADKRLPPLLAAAIHRRRLLWKPVALRRLDAYRAAQDFLSRQNDQKTSSDDAADVAARVIRSLSLLDSAPPSVLEDLPSLAAAEPLDRAGRIDALSRAAAQSKETLARFWSDIRTLESERKQARFTDEQIRKGWEIDQFISGLSDACSDSLAEVACLREAGNLSEAEMGQLGEIEKEVQSQAQRRGPFKTKLQILKLPPRPARALVQAAASATQNPAATTAAPAPLTTAPADICMSAATGTAAVRSAIHAMETSLHTRYREVMSTFSAYLPQQLALPAMRMLRIGVMAQEAEMLYRMRHRRAARRIWSVILAEDPLNLGVYRNLAVCDTWEDSGQQRVSSWRRYLDMLYARAVATDDLARDAATRAQIHRAIAGSHLPRLLLGKLDNDWSEAAKSESELLQVESFLANLARVREVVDHKLLEFINLPLRFTTPSLGLGVSRTERPQQREKAHEAKCNFVIQLRQLFPPRSSAAFVCALRAHYRRCLENAAEKRRIHGSNAVEREEETAYLEFLKEIVHFRFKLHQLVASAENYRRFAMAITSVEVLEEIMRLDQVPIGFSERLLGAVAGSLGRTAEQISQLLKITRTAIFQGLVDVLFNDQVAVDPAQRQTQYKRVINEWAKSPALQDALRVLDDPQSVYPPYVLRAYTDDATIAEAITWLTEFHDRYPELSGPARLLADLFGRVNRSDEAMKLLNTACGKGFYRGGVVDAYAHRINLWITRANTAGQAGDRDGFRSALSQVIHDADVVISECQNRGQVEAAKSAKANAQQALSKM